MEAVNVSKFCDAIDQHIRDVPLTGYVMDLEEWLEEQVALDLGRELTVDEAAILTVAYYAGMIRHVKHIATITERLVGNDGAGGQP